MLVTIPANISELDNVSDIHSDSKHAMEIKEKEPKSNNALNNASISLRTATSRVNSIGSVT